MLTARQHMADFDGDMLILFGDSPLLTAATMERMIARRRADDDPALVATSCFRRSNPRTLAG